MANATSTQLQELYVAYFGRAADPTGLDYWKEAGISTAAFAANMYAQPEFRSAYGSLSVESQVNQIYKNLFDREADVTGLTYWTQQINLGNLQLAEIANHLVWAAQNNSGSEDDKTALTNRTNAAIAYTAKVKESTSSILAYQPLSNGLGDTDFSAGLNITEAVSFLSAINKDTPHTAAGIASSVATITTNGIPEANAKTYTLTSNTDTFAGTIGKDIFQGVFVADGGAGTTINSGDSLVGGDGVDTFNISITGVSGQARKIEGINADVEKIFVSNFDADDSNQAFTHEINTSLSDGLTTVGLSSSNANGDTSFTNLQNIVSAEMKNGSADLMIVHTDAATKGDSDTSSVTFSGQTAGGFAESAASAAGGLEILNVSSVGSANDVDINSVQNSLETVNITGDQNLTTTLVSDELVTVDASAFTGKLVLTTNEAKDQTIKGGTADDTITFAGANFDKNDTVDGGTGTDVLSINNAVANATVLQNVSNIETLKIAGAHNVTIAADANVMNFDLTNAGANTLTLDTGVSSAVTATIGETAADVVTNSANVSLTVKATAKALDTTTSIAGGTGTDVIELTGDTEGDATIDIQAHGVRSVDKITIVDAGDATTGATKRSGKDIKLTTGAYATALTIDGSALDAANVDDVSGGNSGDGIDNDDVSAEILTVDGSSAQAILTITGGGAGDSITGGTKDDVIDGGGGDDTITLTAGGKDNAKGGAGNDKFVFGTTLTKDDVVDGGAGTDTLSVTTLTAANLAGVTNVETLAFTGTATLTKDLSFDTIDLTDGSVADKVTFADGYTKATTVKVENGDSAVNSAKITMAVTGLASDFEAADNTIITGSSSTTNDSMTLTAAGEGTADEVATSGLITNVNTITVVDAGDASTGTGLSGSDFAIDLTSYGTALTIDASALDAANRDNGANGSTSDGKINSTDASEEKLLITGVSNKALTVTGGAGTDTITGSAGNDTLKGGGGVDTFAMTNKLTYEDTIDGGEGTDVLTVSSAIDDVDFMNVSNVETLDLTPQAGDLAVGLGSYFNTSGLTKVILNGSNKSTITATGTTTGVTYELTTAAILEDITAGQGDDIFLVDQAARLVATDVINGGAGSDVIQIDNTYNGGFANTISLVDITNVEKITFKDADGGDTDGSEDADNYTVTLDSDTGVYASADSTDETDLTITVDGSNITDTNDAITVDANNVLDDDFTLTAITGAGADVIKGSGGVDTITSGGGNDTITGIAGADVIDAGAGDDSITGGTGADTLTGGAGKDNFIYALASSESTQSKTDTISDFATGSDEIRISYTTSDGNAAVTYDFTDKGSKTNVAEAIGLLSSTIGEYVYNTSSNQVLLDTDGNGLLQSGDFAVTLTNVTALSDGDIAFDITTGVGGTPTGDTVTTGSGNDTLILKVAADAATTGKGDDVITLPTATAYTGALAFGAGTDELKITLDSSQTGAITGLEKITIAGTKTLTIDEANADTFNAVDGFEVVGGSAAVLALVETGESSFDVSSIVFTNATTTVTVDNNKDDITSGAEAMTVTIDGMNTFTANTKVKGGTGTDVLAIGTTAAVSIASGTVTGMDTLVRVDGDNALTLTAAQANQFTTITGVSAELLTIGADGGDTVLDWTGATISQVNTTIAYDDVDDSIKLGAGADTVAIEAGVDFDAGTVMEAGAGADTLDYNTADAMDFTLGSLTGFTVLDAAGGNQAGGNNVLTFTTAQIDQFTTLNGSSAGGGSTNIVVTADAAATTLDMNLATQAGTAAISYTIDNVADSFAGIGGIDTFVIPLSTGAKTFTSSFKIDGNVGTDVLDINTDSSLDFTAGTIADMETLDLVAGAPDTVLKMTGAQHNDFTTITSDANDAIEVTAPNGLTITVKDAATKFVFGANDAGVTFASWNKAKDSFTFPAVSGNKYVESAATNLNFGTGGFFLITKDVADTNGSGYSTAEASAMITDFTNIDANETAYVAFKATHDAGANDMFIYKLTANANGANISGADLIATVGGVISLDTAATFTAANVHGFTAA